MSEIEVTGSVTILGNDDTSHRIGQTEAQAAFVRDWRQLHAVQAYTRPYICPLCGRAIQTVECGPFGVRGDTGRVMAELIEGHQQEHRGDWTAYEQAGAGGAG